MIESKYYTISKALKQTNGSPIELQVIHSLYDAGLLVEHPEEKRIKYNKEDHLRNLRSIHRGNT